MHVTRALPNMHNATHGHFLRYNNHMSNKTETPKRKPRQYRKITPAQIAEYKALKAIHGNGSAAVRVLEPTRLSPKDRAFRLAKKGEEQSTLDFIDNQLQQSGIDAVNRLGKLVNSSDERIAAKVSTYIIDQLRGQATKKSINLHGKANIQSVLD